MAMQARTPDAITWARMAYKADAEGVTVRQTESGLWIANSGTSADKAYIVTLHSCECKGYAYHGYCKHVAALRRALRAQSRPCVNCFGDGWVPAGVAVRGDQLGRETCRHCGGTGRIG